MTALRAAIAAPLILAGAAFFLAGTVGFLRFPDRHSRLHALAKADNLGLGLTAAGLAVQAGSPAVAAKLAVIWILALLAAATSSSLLARERAGAPAPPSGDQPRPAAP